MRGNESLPCALRQRQWIGKRESESDKSPRWEQQTTEPWLADRRVHAVESGWKARPIMNRSGGGRAAHGGSGHLIGVDKQGVSLGCMPPAFALRNRRPLMGAMACVCSGALSLDLAKVHSVTTGDCQRIEGHERDAMIAGSPSASHLVHGRTGFKGSHLAEGECQERVRQVTASID
ncbi:uncharacterized protein N7459_001837 [Penicillium hispanicum]|uniref:uncharacterized protein n=1 Tax=Penicillium hispanicum TaxID=1080232 RepID=UPI0025416444|nr:uncharacterized protein N7459_001837 [Penicillium hispanicum]KAJ5591468.1 hypothetical protein N7459_001837 [Penicillium hispanicum]